MVKKWVREHNIECVLLLFLIAKMVFYAFEKGFWYDEVVMLGFISRPKLSEIFHIYATMEVSNLPLYAFLMWFVYHIFPPATVFLMLPGILLTAAGVWLLSQIAGKRMGRAASVSILLVSLVSTTVNTRIALELRAYCLMFFSACLVIYAYQKDDKKPVRRFLLRLIAGICLIFSHYFGVLFFAVWGMVTLVKCIRKDWSWKRLIPQVVAGLLFLPWFLHIAKTALGNADSFWIPSPTYMRIPEAFGYLMGSTIPMLIVYALCCIFVFLHVYKEKKWFSLESFCLFIPYPVILGMFFYSRYLAGGGGLFLNKYFDVLLPCMLYTTAAGVQLSCAFLWRKKHLLALLWMLLLLPVLWISYKKERMEEYYVRYSRYSGFAQILREAGDLSSERTMLMLTHHDDFDGLSVYGMYDFYLHRRGVDAANLICFDIHDLQEEMDALQGIDKVYLFSDDDMIEYDENTYVPTWQDGYYCLTIYEKR